MEDIVNIKISGHRQPHSWEYLHHTPSLFSGEKIHFSAEKRGPRADMIEVQRCTRCGQTRELILNQESGKMEEIQIGAMMTMALGRMDQCPSQDEINEYLNRVAK
jgi:hypothetical protein